MAGGTYTLLLDLASDAVVGFGAAGERDLPAGPYAYTGSALGSGGFARVDRHHRLASGEHDARHWHVDYLLGHDASAIRSVVRSVDADIECAVARTLTEADDVTPVPSIGASDCSCDTHLHRSADHGTLLAAVKRAHQNER